MSLDTLSVLKRLQAAGVPQQQAEVQAELWGEFLTQNLANKSDIKKIEDKIDDTNERMDRKFDDVDKKFDDVNKRMDSRFDEVDKKFDDVNKRMDSKFDEVDKKFDDVNKRMDSRFDEVNKQMDSRFDEVNERIENVSNETTLKLEILKNQLLTEIRQSNLTMVKWILPIIVGQIFGTAGLVVGMLKILGF